MKGAASERRDTGEGRGGEECVGAWEIPWVSGVTCGVSACPICVDYLLSVRPYMGACDDRRWL